MAARAIWKGQLVVGEQSLGVKFYSAVEAQGVHFRLLHEKDMQPVRQQMVDARSGDEVQRNEVQKGYEVEEGVFVVLKPEDLAQSEPPPSRDIELLGFLEAHDIPHPWFARPYYLGPDGDDAPYFAFAAALAETKTAALAHWVMRKKPYYGALINHDNWLMMLTLRHAEEVLSLGQLHADAGKALDPKELKLAEQLVGALYAPFEPDAYHDEYRERVQSLMAAKAAGETIPLRKAERKPAVKSLEQALLSSLKAAKENRVA